MAWRLAKSLVVLTAEIKAKAPRTTVYNIGDPAHAARASDHNPNDAGVVCAIDVMPGGGLDLAEFAEDVRERRHPAGKYVIYQDRIASASRNWEWRDHTGEYHTHVHVSVGVGPDGQSTGPYDNTDPWLTGGDDMFCKYGDRGEAVKRLQLALLRLDSKALTSADGIYGDATTTAVKRMLGGDGRYYGAELDLRLTEKLVKLWSPVTPGPVGPVGPAGPQGPAGADGAPGKDGIVPDGATFVMTSPPTAGG